MAGWASPALPAHPRNGRIWDRCRRGKPRQAFRSGDLVYGFGFANPKGGFYAQYVAVAADDVAVIPDTLDLRRAGAIAAVGLTALEGIDRRPSTCGVAKRSSCTVRRAESARWPCSSPSFAARACSLPPLAMMGWRWSKRLGADAAVDGRHEDIALAAKTFAPSGVDAVLALAGGAGLRRCLDALRAGGRMAYPNGVEPAPRKRRGIKVVSYDGEGGVSNFRAPQPRGGCGSSAGADRPLVSSGAGSQGASEARRRTRAWEGRPPGRLAPELHRPQEFVTGVLTATARFRANATVFVMARVSLALLRADATAPGRTLSPEQGTV